VLEDMLPDILCKCKTRCTFIRFVHRPPSRRIGAGGQAERIRQLAHQLLTGDYSELINRPDMRYPVGRG